MVKTKTSLPVLPAVHAAPPAAAGAAPDKKARRRHRRRADTWLGTYMGRLARHGVGASLRHDGRVNLDAVVQGVVAHLTDMVASRCDRGAAPPVDALRLAARMALAGAPGLAAVEHADATLARFQLARDEERAARAARKLLGQ